MLKLLNYSVLYYYYINMKWKETKINRGRWRPKGRKTTSTVTFEQNIMSMKSWDVYYSRKFDKDITGRLSLLWLSWQYKTERVLIVRMKSWETERGTLITKL